MMPTQSMSHPMEMFGYTEHALMVPPFAPADVLILGQGRGTVSGLIKHVWGEQVKIMGVDLLIPPNESFDDYWEGDANKFVTKYCVKTYDFVVVDLYNGKLIPLFVFEEEFIEALARITRKLLAVNHTFYTMESMKVYGKYFVPDAVKTVNKDHVLFLTPKHLMDRMKETNGKEKAEEAEILTQAR